MKTSRTLGIIAAIALILFSIAYPIPEKRVRTNSSYHTWSDNEGTKYVGGDAYNYQIEASLKAGYMSGVLAIKCTAFVGGILLFFLSLYSISQSSNDEIQTQHLAAIEKTATEQTQLLQQILEKCPTETSLPEIRHAATEQTRLLQQILEKQPRSGLTASPAQNTADSETAVSVAQSVSPKAMRRNRGSSPVDRDQV